MLLEILRLTLAGYLLIVAVAAVFGEHRTLIALPGRAVYSVVRLGLYAVTLGRLQLAPPARRAWRRSRLHLRNLGAAYRDWQERRAEEHALATGEQIADRSQWVSAEEARPLATEVISEEELRRQRQEELQRDPMALRPLPPLDDPPANG